MVDDGRAGRIASCLDRLDFAGAEDVVADIAKGLGLRLASS
jgi:hypothetical protein